MTTEPITRFPEDRSLELWRQRIEPPLATFRCGRGIHRCDRLAFVYASAAGGTVVLFFQHTPDRPARLDLADDLSAGWEPGASYKKFDPVAKTAMLHGHKDERGTAVALEDDDHWSDVVEVGCQHHVGPLNLSRADLMNAARRARDTAKSVEVTLG